MDQFNKIGPIQAKNEREAHLHLLLRVSGRKSPQLPPPPLCLDIHSYRI